MNKNNTGAGLADEPDQDAAAAPANPAPVACVAELAAEAPEQPANEVPPDDFGALLRAAREAADMSVPTLAQRLRLHIKQVEALERCDLAALPSLIYVRGFLRSCARELGIDPVPLLAALDRRAGVQTGAAPVPTAGSFRLSRLGDGSRPIIALALAALAIAGLVGIWMPRHANTVAIAPAALPAPPGPSAPAGAPEGAGAKTSEPGADGAKPKLPAAAGNGAAPRPAVKAPVRNLVPPPEPAPVAAIPIEEPVVAAPPVPAAVPEGLVLHVRAASWVEVVQANGVTVFSQLCLPGTEHTIHGVAPLRVVIGNAALVDAQYRGAPVDLIQHANANGVARFTLP